MTVEPAAGRTPLALPAAAFTGALAALLVLGAGVVALRDAIVAAGWMGGTPWIASAIDWIDGLSAETWMIYAGIPAALVGLWWVVMALAPRRKTTVRLDSRTAVFIAPTDIARIASMTAESVSGVLDVRGQATRKAVNLRVETTGDPAVPGIVFDAVTEALASVVPTPKISVRARTGGRS